MHNVDSLYTQQQAKKEQKMDWGKALIELAPSVIQAGTSIFQSERANAEAARQYDQNFGFNKETRDENWKREDNQLQRAVADAQAAGFSPLAAVGNTAVGATASAPSSNVQGGHQADLSGLVSSFGQIMQNAWQSEENEKQRNADLEQLREKIKSEENIANRNRISQEAIAADDRAESGRQFDLKLKSDSDYSDRLLKFQAICQTEDQEYKYAMMYQEWYKENKEEGAPMGRVCSTWHEYNQELSNWYNQAIIALDGFGFDIQTEDTMSEDRETTAGLSAGTNGGSLNPVAKIESMLSGQLGTKSGARGESKTKTDDSGINMRKWEAYKRTHPLPIPPRPNSYNNRHKKFSDEE